MDEFHGCPGFLIVFFGYCIGVVSSDAKRLYEEMLIPMPKECLFTILFFIKRVNCVI